MRGAHRRLDLGPQRARAGPECAPLTARLGWQHYRVVSDGETLLDLPRLELEGPGLVLVLGATGSGKSTLLRSATGVESALGSAQAQGRFTSNTGGTGFVPQDAIDGLLGADAEQEFLLRLRALRRPLAEARREVAHRLAMLRLADRARVPVSRLSAGERRRLLLAAVQVHEPGLLLLDEPFNHVDDAWQRPLLGAIDAAARERLVLVATHEPRLWAGRSQRALVMRHGRIAYDGALDELTAEDFPELRLGSVAPPPRGEPRSDGPRLQIQAVSHTIEGRSILAEVDADLGPGLHALTGPNGSGKTTLLRLSAGLARPAAGRILVNGQDTASKVRLVHHVALEFEEPGSAFFAPTARDELAFTPTNQGLGGCDVEARLRLAVADFDLDAFLERHPYTLSGGERERLALACLQAADAPVLLLDEPTQGLDAPSRRLLYGFLERHRRERCIVAATHDSELVARADSVLQLSHGRLVRPPQEVLARTPS